MQKPARVLNDEKLESSNTDRLHARTNAARPEQVNFKPWRRRAGAATDLTKVKSILSKVLSHRGLDKKVERYGFILHWHEIVGERLAEVSKPECIVNKQLIVNVMHPAWAQELTMIKPVLLESLVKFLRPGDVVKDMTFRVRQLDSFKE
jgi:predicted nucleic acid-binding Zn ribbon protein